MSFESLQLKNKTNVILVPCAGTNSVTVLIMFPVGSRYEEKELQGGAHFIEHLMFKGTKKRPSTLILTREIDRLGAGYNAMTSQESTGYYIKTDAKYLDKSLDILSDMLNNSLFDPKEMQREKTVIVEELRMYQDNPIMNIERIFESLLFQDCPLEIDIGGTEKSVMGLDRKKILEFKEKYYCPENITMVISGKIDDKVKNILEKYFGHVKSSLNFDHTVISKFKPAKFGSAEKSKRLKIENKKTDQTQLMLGFPGLHNQDERQSILALMNTVLGGSMSSRLFIQVRERRGLAYMVHSGADSFRDTGYFFVRAGLEAKNINKAIAVIKSEIKKIKDKGVTEVELKDAKTHIRGSMTLSLEDSSVQAGWYARQALFMDKIKTPEEKLKEIEKVTNKEIIKLANDIFDFEQMRVAVIGNIKEEIKF